MSDASRAPTLDPLAALADVKLWRQARLHRHGGAPHLARFEPIAELEVPGDRVPARGIRLRRRVPRRHSEVALPAILARRSIAADHRRGPGDPARRSGDPAGAQLLLAARLPLRRPARSGALDQGRRPATARLVLAGRSAHVAGLSLMRGANYDRLKLGSQDSNLDLTAPKAGVVPLDHSPEWGPDDNPVRVIRPVG